LQTIREWLNWRIEMTGGEHAGKFGRIVQAGVPPIIRLDDLTILTGSGHTWAPVLVEARA
jgi:hypothetical protein